MYINKRRGCFQFSLFTNFLSGWYSYRNLYSQNKINKNVFQRYHNIFYNQAQNAVEVWYQSGYMMFGSIVVLPALRKYLKENVLFGACVYTVIYMLDQMLLESIDPLLWQSYHIVPDIMFYYMLHCLQKDFYVTYLKCLELHFLSLKFLREIQEKKSAFVLEVLITVTLP